MKKIVLVLLVLFIGCFNAENKGVGLKVKSFTADKDGCIYVLATYSELAMNLEVSTDCNDWQVGDVIWLKKNK